MAPRLIRGGSAPIVRAARFAAERDAEAITERARETARRIVAAAEAEAASVLGRASEASARARRAAERERAAMLEGSTEDVLRLGLELARRITRATLRDDDAAFARMAEALIAEASLEGPGSIAAAPGVFAEIDGFERVADETLGPGDVVIETEAARLDARVDARLAALADALKAPKTS